MAGTPLTLTDMLTYTRQLYTDVDTVDQAFNDTQLKFIINDWYHWWYANFSAQFKADGQGGTDSGGLSYTVQMNAGANSFSWSPVTTPGSDNPPLSIAMVTAYASLEGRSVLKRRDYQDIFVDAYKHAANSLVSAAETGLPNSYGLVEDERSASPTAQVTYSFLVYPVPDKATFISIFTRNAPDDLSGGTDVPRVTPAESRFICRLAASEAAGLIGKIDLAQWLLRALPDQQKTALTIQRDRLRPLSMTLDKTND